MITSIGRHCFLQNWLYKKHKDNNLLYVENIFSRIVAYDKNWKTDIVKKYISRYDWFCETFLKTGHVVGWEFISEELQCRIHYSSKMNLHQMCYNLKYADVVLVLLRNDDCHEQIKYYKKQLASIINKPFKLIGFTNGINQDFISNDYQLIAIQDTMYWNKDKNENLYVPHWHVSDHDIQIFENVWNNIKQFV